MSTSSSSNSTLETSTHQQKLALFIRQRQQGFFDRRRAALLALAILVLGCLNFVSLSFFWTSTQGKEAEGSGWIATSSLMEPDGALKKREVHPSAEIPALRDIVNTSSISNTSSTTPPLLVAVTELPLTPITTAPLTTSTAQIEHVVIISVDGMGADVFALADIPNMRSLVAKGAFSANAQTVKISETLPSHASMLTGMVPEKHGILWGVPYMGWPGINGPTLFSVAHNAGLSTAMVFGKQKMNYLILPNSVDTCFCQDAHDPEIKEQAVKIIQAGLPNILFIHFPDNDRVGHAYGWRSQNQFYAMTYVDGLIGEIVAALENGGYLSNTLLILTADHGGHGLRHGDDSPIDRTIPWLAVGPKVRSGVTLGSSINTYDTAATVLYALDLPIPENWDGKPVVEIFQ